jgi:UDP-N-acetylmuramate--alanine ligase
MKKSSPLEIVHFIGIGGIGMSGLARYFKAQGYAVNGSDAERSPMTDSLKKDAINVKIGHNKGNLKPNTSFVVYNRAIKADNPEIVAARQLQIPVVPYASVLGELTERFATIAITGSHGKSTTTALAGLALIANGVDPTVLIGTNLKEFGGKNIRLGKSSCLVLEADDYGAAFLEYSPVISIVTNIDKEHMDFYKTLGGVKSAFLKFMARTVDHGALILNRDDKNLYSLKSKIATLAKKKKLHVVWYSTGGEKNDSSKTSIVKGSTQARMANMLKKTLQIPGAHNVSNAMAVLELAKLLKLSEKKTLEALAKYQGAWRRMEYRGTFKTTGTKSSLPVFDDYAHHPTEIKATLQAFREKYPAPQKIVCVFQPHQAKRLQILFKDFVGSFTDADTLILLPPYAVSGRDKPNEKFTSEKLAAAISKKYPHKQVYYLADPKRIKNTLKTVLPSSGVIIMMGAGDIVQYTKLLMK